MNLELQDMSDFARGAAFLGAGGGGDPYIGRLLAEHAIAAHGPPELIPLEMLDEDAAVFPVAMFGAPTVVIEKPPSGSDFDRALELLEEKVGRRATALICAEIGGVNATLPVAMAARRGIPLVDADGMGRAFPELQMVTFNIHGVSATPMSIVDGRLNSALIEAQDAVRAERLARSIVVEMGLSAVCSLYAMSGLQARKSAIPGTLSLALGIGRALAAGRRAGDAVAALLEYLRATPYYNHCFELFAGKIRDVHRETRRGFAVGRCLLESLDYSDSQLEVAFQNENLVARRDGVLLAIVPDLICIVDRETGEPIPTEALRYGQRVRVLGVSAAPRMRSPEALAIFGPQAFGLAEPFTPIEELARRTTA